MQGQNIIHHRSSFHIEKNFNGQFNNTTSTTVQRPLSLASQSITQTASVRNPSISLKTIPYTGLALIRCVAEENPVELMEEDDELCPVECVREFTTDEEFSRILEKAKETNSLVVVDFYRTSCGSCKYIEQGFSKLCKGSGDQEAPVIFLKHNVLDEYDEQSEVAERLRIRTVPLFHFYKNGVLLEAFPTRDKDRITEAIARYSSPSSQDV